jgi:hypothetical protein
MLQAGMSAAGPPHGDGSMTWPTDPPRARARLVTIDVKQMNLKPRPRRKPQPLNAAAPMPRGETEPLTWSSSMMQTAKPIDPKTQTEKLRQLREADEEARKAAGTWGDLSVGEVTHQPTKSVYVQVWKGSRRPNLALEAGVRPVGVPPADWPALEAWLATARFSGLHQNVVAWTVSKSEAQRLKEKRMAENRAAGLTVVNATAPAT